MDKSLIIGFDLSFSSTGITVCYLEDMIGKKMQFFRIIFDDQSRKKAFNPKQFRNVKNILYRMPSNLNVDDILLDDKDINNKEQLEITLKAMVVEKKIHEIIVTAIQTYQPTSICFAIENYIMPSFSGPMALKNVSGLIILQGFVRKAIIKICLTDSIKFHLITETPSSIKLFFALNGHADKLDMLKSFINNFEGGKLIPGIVIEDLSYINDVIDSFALVMQSYSKIQKQIIK